MRTTSNNTVTPIINLNGTSAEELLEINSTAIDTLRVAMIAVAAAAPHGRDYQTLHPAIFTDAQAQHDERLNMLRDVLDQLTMIAIEISDQLNRRAR